MKRAKVACTCTDCGVTFEDYQSWTYCDHCADVRCDKYHDGYDAFCRRQPCPTEQHAANGWRNAEAASQTVVVMPERPEGYYHMPIGTFD